MRSILGVARGLSFFGWEGWRVVLSSLALVSFGIGALNWWQAHDPNYTLDGRAKLSQDAVPTLKEVWRESKDVMCVHTFLLIIIQVLFSSLSFLFCQGLTWLFPLIPLARRSVTASVTFVNVLHFLR